MDQPPCRFYLPPEWAPQSGVMLTWPHEHGDWRKHLDRVEPVFIALAVQLARRERVLIVCRDEQHRKHIQARLASAGVDQSRCRLTIAPSNDAWARDHGPITTLCHDEPTLLDFGFNGWGGKYESALDDAITRQLYDNGAFGQTALQRVDMILEGGSIEVDGSGTLMTTRQCLLAPSRNPDLGREKLEARIKELLGVIRFLWLRHGHLIGDDTDSHIDTLARFCDKHTIAYVACDDAKDVHYAELKEMEEELHQFRAIDDKPYRLIPLPWPKAKVDDQGQRLPATYANFLIINSAVLVPTYDDPADEKAIDCIQACFPDREIIGIPSTALIQQFGSLHCVTMQLPTGVI